jgi:general secretion pathway protein E/type IV pilus assembly protein PilB
MIEGQEDNVITAGFQPARVEKRVNSNPPCQSAIGETLVEFGLVSAAQLQTALEQQAREPERRLGSILVGLGFLEDASLAGVFGKSNETIEVDRRKLVIDFATVRLIPKDVARACKVLALAFGDGRITIAVSDSCDLGVIDEIRSYFPGEGRFEPVVWRDDCIADAIGSLYDAPLSVSDFAADALRLVAHPLPEFETNGWANPYFCLANAIWLTAIEGDATAVHFDVGAGAVRISNRVGGDLKKVAEIPMHCWAPLKDNLLSLLALGESVATPPPTDFRSLKFGHRDFSVSGSLVATVSGESLVVRICELHRKPIALRRLGLGVEYLRLLERFVARPAGMFVAVGPGGSGKTTTLFSLLDQHSRLANSLMAVGGEPTFRILGAQHVSGSENCPTAKAMMIRASLEQDPDVLLVGSIDAVVVRRAAADAATSGRKILATMRDLDTVNAMRRLARGDCEDGLLLANLFGITAQRLVQKLCPICKTTREATPEECDLLAIDGPRGHMLCEPVGCPSCRGVGYKGRLVLNEVLHVDDDVRDAFERLNRRKDLKSFLNARGFQTLGQNGARVVRAGETSVAELRRILDLSDLRLA